MNAEKPNLKTNNPNFSSGPTTKRPNWSLSNLENALLGRSHRSSECQKKLKMVIEKSRKLLGLPDNYPLGIMPGSDTGALEASMWSLLGTRGVEVMAWENFGKDWVIDVVEELKIKDLKVYEANYGELPDLNIIYFFKILFVFN